MSIACSPARIVQTPVKMAAHGVLRLAIWELTMICANLEGSAAGSASGLRPRASGREVSEEVRGLLDGALRMLRALELLLFRRAELAALMAEAADAALAADAPGAAEALQVPAGGMPTEGNDAAAAPVTASAPPAAPGRACVVSAFPPAGARVSGRPAGGLRRAASHDRCRKPMPRRPVLPPVRGRMRVPILPAAAVPRAAADTG